MIRILLVFCFLLVPDFARAEPCQGFLNTMDALEAELERQRATTPAPPPTPPAPQR